MSEVEDTTSSIHEESEKKPAGQADGGFAFPLQPSSSPEHRIEVEYSRHYTDEIRIEGNEVVEIQDDDGYFSPDDRIVCSCGEEFDNREQAKEHLDNYRTRFNDLPPYQSLKHPVSFKDEKITILEGCVAGYPSTANHLLIVESGSDYLVATARETYTPPANYAFEDWEPIKSGRLRQEYDDTSRRLFLPSSLRDALQVLTGNQHEYDPERYTVYFRGEEPLYIEGGGKGVLLAPALPGSAQ